MDSTNEREKHVFGIEGRLPVLSRRHRRHRPLSWRQAGGVDRRIRILYSPYIYIYIYVWRVCLCMYTPIRARIHLTHSIDTDSLSIKPGLEPRHRIFITTRSQLDFLRAAELSKAIARTIATAHRWFYQSNTLVSVRRLSVLLDRIRRIVRVAFKNLPSISSDGVALDRPNHNSLFLPFRLVDRTLLSTTSEFSNTLCAVHYRARVTSRNVHLADRNTEYTHTRRTQWTGYESTLYPCCVRYISVPQTMTTFESFFSRFTSVVL